MKGLIPGTDYVFFASEGEEIPSVVKMVDVEDKDLDRCVGGFHTLCVDVGSIPGHPLSGYRAGDVLPMSLWNMVHRPSCKNISGMVYDPASDLWVDIYLVSDPGRKIINLSYNDYVAMGAGIGKRLLSHAEFSTAAEGSNDLTNIAGSSNPMKTGGHVDTLGRRMVSNIGLEDCCGVVWQWLSTVDPADQDWQLLAGGNWGNGTYCGSRSRSAHYGRAFSASAIGARFASEPILKRVVR